MAIEHAVSRERIGPSPAASEAVRNYRLGFRWLLVGYWLVSAFVLAVELPLHRLRRRSSSLSSPYRSGVMVPGHTEHPWRSNVIARARWWIWFGAFMASVPWAHAKFPYAVWGRHATTRVASLPPAMEAIPAAPLGSADVTCSAATRASLTRAQTTP